MKIEADKVRRQILLILQAWGMAPDMAEITSGLMVETDLMGVDSHGVSMLMMYEEMRQAGMLNCSRVPASSAKWAARRCSTVEPVWGTRCRPWP